jgi:dCMP deaminase
MSNNKKQNLELWFKKSLKIAQFSKDQSTKVGALFVNEEHTYPITWGYNGMPRGFPDLDVIKNERPEKYLWIEHAERNAIYNLAQDVLNGCMIICTRLPNMEAARAIVSVGIKKVYIPKASEDLETVNRVTELFNLTGVQLVYLNDKKSIETENKIKKIQGFLDLCYEYAEDFGSDLVEKSACMILKPDTYTYVAMGESGPPEGLKVPDNIKNKDLSFWIQEPEKNAIFNLIRPKLKNATAYVSWCPCSHCALAMKSVGVKRVVTKQLDYTNEADLRWKEHFEASQETLKREGVDLILL